MNIYLFYSSVFHTFIIIRCSQFKKEILPQIPVLVGITYLGTATSIANHLFTYYPCVIADRSIMAISALVYLFHIVGKSPQKHQKYLLNILIQSITMYFIAKQQEIKICQNVVHIFAHMNVSYLYWRILCLYSPILANTTREIQ